MATFSINDAHNAAQSEQQQLQIESDLVRRTHRDALEIQFKRGDYLHALVKALDALTALGRSSYASTKEKQAVYEARELLTRAHSGVQRDDFDLVEEAWRELHDREIHPGERDKHSQIDWTNLLS
jgi:vacuolar-type H+-ATPase subunit I/STV1